MKVLDADGRQKKESALVWHGTLLVTLAVARCNCLFSLLLPTYGDERPPAPGPRGGTLILSSNRAIQYPRYPAYKHSAHLCFLIMEFKALVQNKVIEQSASFLYPVLSVDHFHWIGE